MQNDCGLDVWEAAAAKEVFLLFSYDTIVGRVGGGRLAGGMPFEDDGGDGDDRRKR